MPLNMVDPEPIPSSVKLLLPAAATITGGIPKPLPHWCAEPPSMPWPSSGDPSRACREFRGTNNDENPLLPEASTNNGDSSTSYHDSRDLNKLDIRQTSAKNVEMTLPSQAEALRAVASEYNVTEDGLRDAIITSRSSLVGDVPTLKEIKEVMMAAKMPIPVDSVFMGKLMKKCPNEEIMANLQAMQVDSSCAATDGGGCSGLIPLRNVVGHKRPLSREHTVLDEGAAKAGSLNGKGCDLEGALSVNRHCLCCKLATWTTCLPLFVFVFFPSSASVAGPEDERLSYDFCIK